MYVNMRAGELIPIARSIAAMMADTSQPEEGRGGKNPLLDRRNKDFLGALLYIYDSDGQSVMNSPAGSDKVKDKGKDPSPGETDFTDMISADLKDILKGKEISDVRNPSNGQSYLVVGVPIENDGEIKGAVIFTKSMRELSDAMSGFNLTLIISTLTAFVIMLIPGYFVAKRIVMPIRRVEAVAHSMSAGDFTVRADESQKGEIGQLAHSVNHFAAESGRLEQTRRDYVANVSHELRMPIAAIRAMGETLRDGMAKTVEKRDLFYNNIVRESMRLSRLVDDLLELSRLQSGAAVIQKIRFDLREAIQNAYDIYNHIAEEANIQLALSVNMEENISVFSSSDRIEQVLVILLDNAIKHPPEDSVIVLEAIDKSSHIEICVSDTGEGIQEEDLPHIFERFYKADKSHSGKRGTGLGLSIAYEVIHVLDETIEVENTPQGTSFFFTVHKD